jgi:hypothetical protein
MVKNKQARKFVKVVEDSKEILAYAAILLTFGLWGMFGVERLFISQTDLVLHTNSLFVTIGAIMLVIYYFKTRNVYWIEKTSPGEVLKLPARKTNRARI